jgi:hypothetical protein
MRDLPTRLHALLTELLGELLERGADRQWVATRVQQAVDLVHEVAECRAPDPRRAASLRQARRLEKLLEASYTAGYSSEDAAAAARARLQLSKSQYHRLLRQLRDIAQRPRLTLPASDGEI